MSDNVFRREIEFGSLLSYSVKDRYDKPAIRSRIYKDDLKKDGAFPFPSMPMSIHCARTIRAYTRPSFASWFQARPVLIPLPTHCRSDWSKFTVPEKIAFALNRTRLGRVVDEIVRLARAETVPSSHSSTPVNRLTPQRHYQTMEMQWIGDRTLMDEPKEILLIDDVVTRGSTFLGALNRVAEEFPYSTIRAFAMMRAMSNPEEFYRIYEPVTGKITLEAGLGWGWPFRRP